eukprot:GABV01007478.1.p1 GENE.GABV01007478.1~~GABV01007478.1.p1  ORF type:complete len:104 (-),score=15.26 GABV01007478.1:11-322(-)
MIGSAAGAFISAWILGVRDRHSDNILISPDGSLFHIDFGYILGRGVTVDTGPFAITKDLQKLFGDKWQPFVDTCVKSFAVLRTHARTIMEWVRLVLSPCFDNH